MRTYPLISDMRRRVKNTPIVTPSVMMSADTIWITYVVVAGSI